MAQVAELDVAGVALAEACESPGFTFFEAICSHFRLYWLIISKKIAKFAAELRT